MSKITLIGADFCRPCKYLKENIAEWAKSVECDIPIIFEEWSEDKHFIKKLPTLVYTYEGLERQRLEGTNEKQVKVWLMNSSAYNQFSLFGFED